ALFPRGSQFVAQAQGLEPVGLQLFELLEQPGDFGKFLERFGLQRGFHLGEAEGVVFLVVLFGLAGASLTVAVLVVIVGRGFFLLVLVIVFLVGWAGGLFADLAV